MHPSVQHRTIAILLFTIVVLTGISIFHYLWSPSVDGLDKRFKKSLVSEMETMMDIIISDQRRIVGLNRQVEFARSGQLPNEAPQLPSFPSFEPRKGQRPEWPNDPGTLHAFEFPFHEDLAAVKDRISSVQTALASSDSKFDAARKAVRSLRRHLHDQAEMIRASNDRLAAIAALDRKRYIYFNLSKRTPVAVDELRLLLKKADPKHNRFTLELLADNRTLTEKNRGIQEPIQIYVQKYSRACEVVVNDISQNSVSGYVSLPER